MGAFSAADRRWATAIARLAYVNPFTPERVAVERLALGDEFSDLGTVWSALRGDLGPPELHPERPNISRLRERSWALGERAAARIRRSPSELGADELALYEGVALYALFSRYEHELYKIAADDSRESPKIGWYGRFKHDFEGLFGISGASFPSRLEAAHTLAIFFQIRRAFHYVFRYILGSSAPVAALRAETWHSIFTHDLRRYQRSVYRRMADIPTLIVGPSGTGKELVAQAIGYSRYIAFDEARQRFVEAFARQFHPLNVSALSRGLVEAELFGHRRGSFTGALDDRQGFLEASGPDGTVFLDEIGELGIDLQVKFLRVLQTRSFQRLGETTPRLFLGKIAAATHRDLDEGMRAGWFREDLYYRLCADRIEVPSLRARLDADPSELGLLVAVIAERVAGEEFGEALAREVLRSIEREVGLGYAWPGNVRELEQCVRNVLIRKSYRPPRRTAAEAGLDTALVASRLSAEALLERYTALVYGETSSYVETGRRLGVDRRTVKDRVERAASQRPRPK